jgi:hypothetical protein
MRVSNAATRERHESLQVRQQRFFDGLHGQYFRPAGPGRKARTRHGAKFTVTKGSLVRLPE